MIDTTSCEYIRAQNSKELRAAANNEYDFSLEHVQQILRKSDWDELQYDVPEMGYTTFNFPYWLQAS